MKPRHKRLALIGGGLVAVALASALVLNAFQSNLVFFFTPTQVAAGEAPQGTAFRIGGLVKDGTLKRNDMTVRFIVTDTAKEMPVAFTGILPDLFRDNQSVIATGHMDNARFVATEVLAKHDETYMPKELKDAMAKAHKDKPMPQGSDAGGAL